MTSMADTMPELVLVAETDAAAARRLAAQGTLLRLACSDGPRPLITRYYGAIARIPWPDAMRFRRVSQP